MKARILIVDDEADFRAALAFGLKRKGYEVLEASNGRQAFELIQTEAVDLVLSDIQMPGGNGVELLDRTRGLDRATPVILLITGFSELSAEEAHHRGAEALIGKPFDRKTLEETIERLLTPPGERWARESGRIEVDFKVHLRFPGIQEAVDAKVVNLGRGGAFVALPHSSMPNVSDSVSFEMALNDSAPGLCGTGTVKWIRIKDASGAPSGCGLEFTYLDEAARKQVLDLLDAENPIAYIPKN